jgi:hypothetical protein
VEADFDSREGLGAHQLVLAVHGDLEPAALVKLADRERARFRVAEGLLSGD